MPLVRTLLLALGACACAATSAAARRPEGMVLIPAGSYSPLAAPAGGRPAIPVPAFYLDVRPVTNAEFLEFVRADPAWRRSRADPRLADPGYLGDWAGELDPGPAAPARSPVVRVSWFAARAYALWRGKRLPTVAEWERAAAAGFTRADGAADPLCRKAAEAWFSGPAPAVFPSSGSGRPNFLGVRDMTDLVWEWVEDFDPAAAACGESLPGRSSAGLGCAGGSVGVRDFTNYPAFLRAAFRSSLRRDYVLHDLGFRCARTPGMGF